MGYLRPLPGVRTIPIRHLDESRPFRAFAAFIGPARTGGTGRTEAVMGPNEPTGPPAIADRWGRNGWTQDRSADGTYKLLL